MVILIRPSVRKRDGPFRVIGAVQTDNANNKVIKEYSKIQARIEYTAEPINTDNTTSFATVSDDLRKKTPFLNGDIHSKMTRKIPINAGADWAPLATGRGARWSGGQGGRPVKS